MFDDERTEPSRADFRALFRAHAPFVWHVLRRYGVPASELEDACQEVFVVVHRQLPGFEARSSLRTWLYAIARRTALAQRRLHQRHAVGETSAELHDQGTSPEAALQHARDLDWLERELARLDEAKREAFVLVELEELSPREAAEILGCAPSVLHYRLNAARDAISAASRRAAVLEEARSPRAPVSAGGKP